MLMHQECECAATTYNLLTNYLSLREILIINATSTHRNSSFARINLANDNAKCNVFYDRRRTDYSHNFTPVLGV